MIRDGEGLFTLVRTVAPALVPRSLAYGLVTVLAAGFLWFSPQSPLPLQRADVLLGEGDALHAVLAYDTIAQKNPFPSLRAAALERAAKVWTIELMSPREARHRLEQLLWYRPAHADTADLLAQIANLLLDEKDYAAASVRFREAHDLAPMAAEAPDRLAAAAQAADHAGDLRLADGLWRRLGRAHPERRAQSEVGRATVALHEGKVEQALTAYRRAAANTFDPDLAAAATLGATVCLARLGDVSGAIAALDEVDLPSGVTAPRTEALEARRTGEAAP